MKRHYLKLVAISAVLLSSGTICAISPVHQNLSDFAQQKTLKKKFIAKPSDITRISAPVVEYIYPPKTSKRAYNQENLNSLTVTISGNPELY